MTDAAYIRTIPLMGTIVTIQVIGHARDSREAKHRAEAVEHAFGWFHRVEECCTRFEPESELMQLSRQVGVPVSASAILYEAVQFALAVAQECGGAFDPTVGYAMETRGFNRDYRTGQAVQTALDPGGTVSYRDVCLDPIRKTILLLRPLMLDLGAVAKGLAIDLAARELRPLENFAVDAGGDIYVGGCNANGEPWTIGIRHPRDDHELIDTIRVSDSAVCTSGDYERRISGEDSHHILNPRTGKSARNVASVTVVAPTAMLADALATAAFVLGPEDGIPLIERLGIDALIVSPNLERYATGGMQRDYQLGSAAILPNA